MSSHKIAKLVKDNLPGFNGRAALYELTPPLEHKSWWTEDAEVQHHTFVVASAANVIFSGPETYLFPADAEGAVTNWGELPGSTKGTLSHADALAGAGYEIS